MEIKEKSMEPLFFIHCKPTTNINIPQSGLVQTTPHSTILIRGEFQCDKTFEDDISVYKELRPMLGLLQGLGVCPIQYSKRSNAYKHTWKSVPAVFNIILLLMSTLTAIDVLGKVNQIHNDRRVSGTDYYAATINVIMVVSASIIVLAAGNLNGSNYCRGNLKFPVL